MPHMQAWGATQVFLTRVLWAVMMVAMMTPSAAMGASVLVEKRLPRDELVERVLGGIPMPAGLLVLGQRWLTYPALPSKLGGPTSCTPVGRAADRVIAADARPGTSRLTRPAQPPTLAPDLYRRARQ